MLMAHISSFGCSLNQHDSIGQKCRKIGTLKWVPRKDLIVEIPESRVKFFGRTGKMLLPSPATVAALIKEILSTN